ncbi:SIS domain-containing protein [Enterococcus sp. DIV0179]|uniref:SIS domain-containing protein n=1 Tax=Enterococcus sp. DIV0179 TaxID=2774767 RepID=UPI003D3003DD
MKNGIEKIADKISKDGYKNIFFIASGGSWVVSQTFEYYWKQHSSIPVFNEIAAEYVLSNNKQVTRDSIVILQSKSGDTTETVKAAQMLKEKNIRTIGIVRKGDSPLANSVTYPIVENVVNLDGSDPENVAMIFLLFRLLYNQNEFAQYDKLVKSLENLPQALVSVRKQADKFAEDFSNNFYQEEYQMWVGGGSLTGKTYSFAMCVLEEMLWIKTKSIHTAEFFHGSFEVLDEDTCCVLVKGEDVTRSIGERVEKFMEKIGSKKFSVIDTKDYKLEGIDDDFREIFGQMIVTGVVDRISVYLERDRDHSLDTRRYYRVMDY